MLHTTVVTPDLFLLTQHPELSPVTVVEASPSPHFGAERGRVARQTFLFLSMILNLWGWREGEIHSREGESETVGQTDANLHASCMHAYIHACKQAG